MARAERLEEWVAPKNGYIIQQNYPDMVLGCFKSFNDAKEYLLDMGVNPLEPNSHIFNGKGGIQFVVSIIPFYHKVNS